jgi:uncharacterized protein with ParB-like and HNH nuclease domain
MEATVLRLYEYLNQDKIDKIPVYQRNYSWQKENCEQLFNDILSAGEKETIESHFIGSIIVIVDGGIDGNKNIIIDGQQRITTAILFLKAFYDNTTDEYIKDEYIKRLIFKITKNGKVAKLILNRDDNIVLEKILNNSELTDRDKSSKLYKNYDYFTNRIKNSEDEKLQKGFEKLRIVGIKLNLNENPQLIFESLNSTGLKLNATDLIRNFLLMSENSEEQDRLYLKYWYKIEENITSESMEEFFKSFLVIKLSSDISQKKVYEKFKEFKKLIDLNSEQVLQELLFYSKLYSKLLFTNLEQDKDIKNTIIEIEVLNQKVIYPFLLECYANYERGELEKKDFLNILEFLENYLIRSIVCEISSKGLNKFNPTLIKKLNENGNKFENMKKAFILNKSKNRMQSDKEFINSLKHNNIYSNKTLKNGKLLLYKIESFLSKKEIVVDDNLTVEHIMPQTLTKQWKDELQNYKEFYDEYKHTIGNLTLTAYNSELSNNLYKDKKLEFQNSNLSLNRYFNNIDNWNQLEIENRANKLIEYILEIYPQPNELNKSFDELNIFTLSDKNEINVTGKKPDKFELFNKIYSSKSWRNLYTKVVEKTYELHQDIFLKHIERNSFNTNKNLLSTNIHDMGNLSYEKIDNFYLNTNLSAIQILSNLSTIFELLSIDEDELIINLGK